MSAKSWSNCKGGLKCPFDRISRRQMKRHKQGWSRLLRRRGKAEAIQRTREAA